MNYKYDEAKQLIDGVQNAIGIKHEAWDICVALHKLIAAVDADQKELRDRVDRIEAFLAKKR
jgi:hypothetical protein